MVPVLEACAKKVAAQGPHARLQGQEVEHSMTEPFERRPLSWQCRRDTEP